MASDWGEVVTRYPYRKVRMDHLLSKENLSKLYFNTFTSWLMSESGWREDNGK